MKSVAYHKTGTSPSIPRNGRCILRLRVKAKSDRPIFSKTARKCKRNWESLSRQRTYIGLYATTAMPSIHFINELAILVFS